MKDQPVGAYGPAVQKALAHYNNVPPIRWEYIPEARWLGVGGHLALMLHHNERYRIADDKSVKPLIIENGPFR